MNHLEYEQLVTQVMEARRITQNAPVRVPKEDGTSVGGATAMHNQVTEGIGEDQLGKSHSANEAHSASLLMPQVSAKGRCLLIPTNC